MPKPLPAEFRRDVVAVARKHEAPIAQIARDYGPEDLEHVAHELNARPRKTLNWDSPAEQLRDLLVHK